MASRSLLLILLVFVCYSSKAQKSLPDRTVPDQRVPYRMVRIKGGTFVPLYGSSDSTRLKVQDFLIDQYPVTNAEYLAFVE